MFVTAFLLWLVATEGLALTTPILIAALGVDVVAWGAISNGMEAWATETTSNQEFWKDDGES